MGAIPGTERNSGRRTEPSGTKLLDDINPQTQPSDPTYLGAVGVRQTVIFTAWDGVHGQVGDPAGLGIFRSDGTASSTTFVQTVPSFDSFETGNPSTGTAIYWLGAEGSPHSGVVDLLRSMSDRREHVAGRTRAQDPSSDYLSASVDRRRIAERPARVGRQKRV